MLKRTHEAFSGTFWLGGTLGINLISYKLGNELPVHPAIALVGIIGAVPFSAGKNSPDIDHIWWPGFPKRGYPLWGHRGITHRFWFASLLTLPFLVPFMLAHRTEFSILGPLFLTLPAGWWSHLFGDMIYGRLRICGRVYGLGWTTGGLSETGKRKIGGKRFIVDPAAKFFTGVTIVLATLHLFMFAHLVLGIS